MMMMKITTTTTARNSIVRAALGQGGRWEGNSKWGRLYSSATKGGSSIPASATAPAPAPAPAATPTQPPILSKIRADLKTAMRSKNTPHLLVLRSLLSSHLNASKTHSPILTNPQFYTLIRKTISSSQTSILEFKANGREDLVRKEEEQIAILEEYLKGSGEMGGEEVRRLVGRVVSEERGAGGGGKLMGRVMGRVSREVEGRADMGSVRRIVEEEIKAAEEGGK